MKTHRIAYLVSQYPAYSHTFILREIQQLRQFDMSIAVASINLPDRSLENLTTIEKEEAEHTFYIKHQGLFKAAKALMKTLFFKPLGLMHGLTQVFKLGGWDVKRLLFHFFYLAEAMLVGQWMHSQQLTHLHVHFATPAASVGLLVKVIFGYGFSFTVHGPDEFYDASGYNLPEKILAADFIFCISHYACSQMMKLSPINSWTKFDVCRLGVDPEHFMPKSHIEKTDTCHLLCVGRLTSAKGQAVLLDAVAALYKQKKAVTLTLIGMGPDQQNLIRYAQKLGIHELVTFTGAIDQDHILAYYQAADIFILPSFAEGLPVVLMEAMAMEIPCISTAITGIPELITNGQDGLLVCASDTEGLIQAIVKLVNNPPLRNQLGKAGRVKVVSNYDLYKNTHSLFQRFVQRLEKQ